MHAGRWRKIATSSYEIRGKVLGIVGYGHIGTQVGILAESMGMHVLFFDIVPRLPMGNNRPVATLQELLSASDFISLHVPATPQTKHMIGESEFGSMRHGSYLLNLSRGTVVNISALDKALESGRVAGAALDVFPEEPDANTDSFAFELQNKANVVLSPHVGGSTEEAQESIGREVTSALIKFVNSGATIGSVNFPKIRSVSIERPASHPQRPQECSGRAKQHQSNCIRGSRQHRKSDSYDRPKHWLFGHGP